MKKLVGTRLSRRFLKKALVESNRQLGEALRENTELHWKLVTANQQLQDAARDSQHLRTVISAWVSRPRSRRALDQARQAVGE